MKYGLIGEKLGHSFSKEIHNRLFDYDYELKELAPECLQNFIKSKNFKAINVTIPYKEAVIPYLDYVDETAKAIGAVNTVVHRDGKLYGYNTDYLGLKALISYSGISLKDKTVLILGSGGTSKTAMAVAESLGCQRVIRVSRVAKNDCITYSQAKEQFSNAEVMINTTPCGMYPQIGECAVDITDFPALQGVVDVVYNPLRTKLVCDALSRCIPAVGGLYMLVAQAAFAAELFSGIEVPSGKIDTIYQKLLSDKENVVLIGMPGCGKTTVGKRIAQQLEKVFVDTDEEIIRQEGRPIRDIILTDGEAYFRHIESKIIRQISARQSCIIATGGGAVLNAENMALLRENGRIYFLDRPLESLCATEDRPLSANRKALEQRYQERYSLYCWECNRRIKVIGTAEEAADQIIKDLMK